MTTNHPYTKSAGISLLVHGVLFCLALIIAVQVVPPPPVPPPPIEVIEPSKLVSMGSGKLQLTSGSPRPVKAARQPRIRMASAKPAAPKAAPPEPPPAAAPSTLEEPPLPLSGEITETSVAVPLSGDKEGAAGGTGAGGTPGGGRGTGGVGAGTGASVGDAESGGDYTGTGFRSGALPGYPQSARKAGREGIVTVRVLVGTDGTPASVTVRVSSGHEDFDTAAVAAVKKWHFSPAKKGKEPVASFHDVRIRFRLDEAR